LKSKSNKLVSVIVPTLNNERTIYNCLDSIRSQSFDTIEPIIVDSHSTDQTVEIAKRFSKNVIIKESGTSSARNIGIRSSKGKFILSVDSDMVLGPDIVKECIAKIKDYDALIIPEESIGAGFWSRCKAFERSFYADEPLVESPRFFRRSALEQIGFYDDNLLFGEDRDITNKLLEKNMRIGRIDSLITHDEGRITLLKLWRKNKKYGFSFLKYKSKYPALASKQIGLARIFTFLRGWRKLLMHPLLTFGMIFALGIQYLAFSYGIDCYKVRGKHE
jgi:glycosyltransferase involved in cell wall biosynthesis